MPPGGKGKIIDSKVPAGRGYVSSQEGTPTGHVCQGLNSHYFHIIGDGHQPNSRDLYTHHKDFLLKVGWVYPQENATFDHGTCVHLMHPFHNELQALSKHLLQWVRIRHPEDTFFGGCLFACPAIFPIRRITPGAEKKSNGRSERWFRRCLNLVNFSSCTLTPNRPWKIMGLE